MGPPLRSLHFFYNHRSSLNEPEDTMTPPKSKNITWHGGVVTRQDRERAASQKGCVVWFTGLSGSGKSTVARRFEQLLLERGRVSYVLDSFQHPMNLLSLKIYLLLNMLKPSDSVCAQTKK